MVASGHMQAGSMKRRIRVKFNTRSSLTHNYLKLNWGFFRTKKSQVKSIWKHNYKQTKEYYKNCCFTLPSSMYGFQHYWFYPSIQLEYYRAICNILTYLLNYDVIENKKNHKLHFSRFWVKYSRLVMLPEPTNNGIHTPVVNSSWLGWTPKSFDSFLHSCNIKHKD